MKLRAFFALITLVFISSFTSFGQDIPQELINTWEYYGADEVQILTIFSDGSFAFYTEERSTSDAADADCERSVEAWRGTIEISGEELALNQDSRYSIEFPSCGLRLDGEVDEKRAGDEEFAFEYDASTNQLTLDDMVFNGRYAGVSLEAVELSDDEPIPAEFVGDWLSDLSTEGMTLSSLLQLGDDGEYSREYLFITEESELILRDSGEASLEDMILTLEQDESVMLIDGDEFDVESGDESNVVWLALEDGKMSIYINGFVSYLEGEPGQEPEDEDDEEGGGTASLFEEDFEENETGWEEGSGRGYTSEFDDGVYRMEFDEDAEYTGWIVGPGFEDWDLAPQFEGSYSYQFDFRGDCDEICGVSMVVGLEEDYEGGTAMYYWPLDDRDGFFRLYDRNEGDVLDEGEPFDRVDVFDGDWHTLRLEVSEDNLEFFIDGESIYEYDEGDIDNEGSIGLLMVRDDTDYEFEVEFDNVIVEALD